MKLFQFANICLNNNGHELNKFLVSKNILNKTGLCHKCGNIVKLNSEFKLICRKTNTSINEHKKTVHTQCNTSISSRNGIIFSNAKLNLGKLCLLLAAYFCIDNVKRRFLKTHLEISNKTVNKYIKLSEIVIARWMKSRVKEELGGEGKTVECDETKIAWRKFNRGRFESGVWIFGGVERGTGRAFMVPVERRNFGTLSTIIKKRIKTSTRILTDCWKGYSGLKNLNYCHYTVNHKKGFVNKKTGVHTQKIERVWRELKEGIPKYGINKKNINRKISKYIFCRTFNDEVGIEALFDILSQFS